MNIRTLCLLLLCLVALGACKESSPEPEPLTGVYGVDQLYPLLAGNDWSYHAIYYNNDGSIQRDTTENIHIQSTQSIVGHTGFSVTGIGGDSSAQYLYLNGTTDLFKVKLQNSIYSTEQILRYPLNIDEPYMLTDTINSGQSYRSYLVLRSKTESVTVPAKTFSCFYFEQINLSKSVISSKFDTAGIEKYCYSLGVGLVQSKKYIKDNLVSPPSVYHLTETRELTSYTIK